MLQFEWSDEYVIDNGEIDQEHRALLKMANQVFAVADSQANREEITDLVKALFRYMEKHFEHEERFMQQIAYPGLAEHVVRHRQIVADMTAALREIHALQDYLDKLRHMMVDWVIRHIADDDQKIAAYLPQQASTA